MNCSEVNKVLTVKTQAKNPHLQAFYKPVLKAAGNLNAVLGCATRNTLLHLVRIEDLAKHRKGADAKRCEMTEITKSAILYTMMIVTLNTAIAISVMGLDFLP